MKFLSTILFYIITTAIGALFLFSAYTKIIGIQNFEWTLAETNLFSFSFANIISRILIIVEAILGAFFLLNIFAGKKLYTLAALLLAFFNIYLIWVMFQYGVSGNCGCFGDVVKMTPVQASLKNLGLIALIYLLSIWQTYHRNWIPFLVSIACIAGISYWIPPEFIYIKQKTQWIANEPINLDTLYTADASAPPSFDYKKGKYLICVFSTTCHHCKSAARKIGIIQKRNPKMPIYAVFSGDSTSLKAFFEESKSQNVPYQLNKSLSFIYSLTKLHAEVGGFPKILWVHNGKLVRVTNNYFDLNDADLNNWLD